MKVIACFNKNMTFRREAAVPFCKLKFSYFSLSKSVDIEKSLNNIKMLFLVQVEILHRSKELN